jgi:hypothetical protein
VSNEWRRVAAALSNPVRRSVYAQLILGVAPSAPRLDRVLADLRGAGLISAENNVIDSVFADLLAADAPVTRTGVERFIRDGRLEQYPSRPDDRAMVLEWAASHIPADDAVSESAINEILAPLVDDVASLRRYLVDAGLLERDADGTAYRRA